MKKKKRNVESSRYNVETLAYNFSNSFDIWFATFYASAQAMNLRAIVVLCDSPHTFIFEARYRNCHFRKKRNDDVSLLFEENAKIVRIN